MDSKRTIATVALALLGVASARHAFAYPLDPAKVPVNIGQDPSSSKVFVLAYDTDNHNIVYYAPKTGRTASLNGMPLISYANFIAPDGLKGYLNAQMEFGVFGAEKDKLFAAIRRAGKTPVPFPYHRTTIIPLTPGIDPATGRPICVQEEDPATGEMVEECDPTLFDQLVYSTNGPSLGENLAVTALLNSMGAAVFGTLLRGGNAFQMNVNAEYYAAGSAFTATVRVDYDRMFESFHAVAGFNGFFTSAQAEGIWRREGLCLGRSPDQCGIFVTYRDASTGQVISTPTIDPDNAVQQNMVFQAIQRLVDRLQQDMLTPISTALKPLDTSQPAFGFKVNAQYEHLQRGVKATFNFASPRGVNVATTVFPVALGCVLIDQVGNVSRNLAGDCAGYWSGS
jgi:hypothetical protein